MKKLILLTLISVSAIFIISCDRIKNPAQNSTVKTNTRKIFLEDYTGHQCPNCPRAAETAEQLHDKYGDKLVIISVHAGFFTAVNTEFPMSYTTQAGNDWNSNTSGFGVGSLGYPNGLINRKNYADNGLVHGDSKWPTTVSLAASDMEFCDLSITPSYNSTNRKLTTSIKTKFRRSYPNNTKLCVVLTEDSIIGPQKEHNKPTITNYVFMHMLRGSINGSWGENLKAAPIKYQDSIIKVYPDFVLDNKFKDKHISVVAFVYDEVTREVIQVEKTKIK